MKRLLLCMLLATPSICFAQKNGMFAEMERVWIDSVLPSFYSGNELYQHRGSLLFLGYVAAVHDSLKFEMEFCSPQGVTVGQMRDIVEKYLRENPENRNQQAHLLVRSAFVAVWPCPKPSSR